MTSGDQFHDILHLTRVRREISANERQAFLDLAVRELAKLDARQHAALLTAQQTRRDAAEGFRGTGERLLAIHTQAASLLQQIQEAGEEDWYPLRSVFEESLEKLRQEVRTLESLSSA